MADYSEKIFFSNSIFKFTSSSCDCCIDITHPSKGVKKYTYRLYPKDDTIYYAYITKNGLVSKKRDGAVDGRKVLSDLLAIKEGDSKAVKSFIERHGFLFPLNPNKDNSVESEVLFGIINRLQATVWLMTALGEVQTDYSKVLALTMYLLLTPQTSVELPNGYDPFFTCPHDLGCFWHDINSIEELVLQVGDEANKGFYIDDVVRPSHTFLDMGEYDEAIGYGKYDFSTEISKIIYLFRNAVCVRPHCRLAIDFFYHFYKDVGCIQTWNHKGELTFSENSPSVSERFKNGFDEQLKIALMALAKHTLKMEIEYNLLGIEPSYDIESMSPSWRVNYLLSGLYFSVFFTRPEYEIYRICANPNCGQPFSVKTTSHKQKYCKHACANATAQSKHKLKKKKQIVNNDNDPSEFGGERPSV